MVKNALHSIQHSNYSNFEVAFIDDGSPSPGKKVVEEYLPKELVTKFTFYNTNQTTEEKISQGGSIFGSYANKAMSEISHDIVFMLCDDDALTPEYLTTLNSFFLENESVNHCYSNILFYNPSVEYYTESKPTTDFRHIGSRYNLNKKELVPFHPCGNFDASQVAWRSKCNIKFPYPRTRALDAEVYKQLGDNYGPSYPTGTYGQCKGCFEDQLGNRWRATNKEYETNTK